MSVVSELKKQIRDPLVDADMHLLSCSLFLISALRSHWGLERACSGTTAMYETRSCQVCSLLCSHCRSPLIPGPV